MTSPYVRARETGEAIRVAGGLSRDCRDFIVAERFREKELGALDRLTGLGIKQFLPDETVFWARLGKFYNRPPALAFLVIDHDLLAPEHQGKSYVAVVNRGGQTPALTIRIDTAARTVYVRPLTAEAPPNRSLELWYINAAQAPKSLGVVQNAPARVWLPEDPGSNKVTLAVISEPVGGSPTGASTGPIVYSGELFAE